MKFTLLHPSRSRPKLAVQTAQEWIRKAGVPVEHILSLDSDDPELLRYALYNDINQIVNRNKSAVDAINNAAKVATGDILIVMSDDFECPDNWAQLLMNELQGKEDFILKTPDGTQGWIITLPIMDRKYYERFGYIYYPEYRHMFCDTELTCVADLLGRKLVSKIPFNHAHYSVKKTERDEVSIRADKTWDQGEKLFIERYKKNFDLVNHTGRITDQGYIRWINSKL